LRKARVPSWHAMYKSKSDTHRDLTNWKIVSSKSSTVCQKWNYGHISDMGVLVTGDA